MARIYVETTIPSFYYEIRTEPEMIARREWTRQWWEMAVKQHQLLISLGVVAELERGDFPGRNDGLELIDNLPILDVTEDVTEIVEAYVAHTLMPADPEGDALHLALASYYKCDFLVTWNCKHLANANKFGHIRRINGILGIHVPTLVTPLEFLGDKAK